MADCRMIAVSVVKNELFLSMHATARLLYYDFCVRGDDDGFIDSPKRIMKITSATERDMKELVASGLLMLFDSGALVVKHWQVHNRVRNGIYNPTIYQKERKMLREDDEGAYFWGIPTSTQASSACQPSGCIGKLNEGEISLVEPSPDKLRKKEIKESGSGIHNYSEAIDGRHQKVVDLFNSICPSYPKVKTINNARKRLISELLRKYAYGDIKRLFEAAESSYYLKGKINPEWGADFNWLISLDNAAKVLSGDYSSDADDWEDIEHYIYKQAYENAQSFYHYSRSYYGDDGDGDSPHQCGVEAVIAYREKFYGKKTEEYLSMQFKMRKPKNRGRRGL